MLGTGQICSLQPGFVITGLDDRVSLDLGLKKLKKSVRYNRKFAITGFVITEFHCICITNVLLHCITIKFISNSTRLSVRQFLCFQYLLTILFHRSRKQDSLIKRSHNCSNVEMLSEEISKYFHNCRSTFWTLENLTLRTNLFSSISLKEHNRTKAL
jgi:hypothetical protein